MNALGFYISTCRYVMQANPTDRETWLDLYRYLPYLRQSLSCYVCGNILHIPIGPTHNVCPHHVCQKCRGGKMRLKPSCSWCKDHESFKENIQLRILIMCFKKLCEYIHNSPIGHELRAIASNGETNNLGIIVQEGMSVYDEFQLSSSSETFPFMSNVFMSNKPRIKNQSSEKSPKKDDRRRTRVETDKNGSPRRNFNESNSENEPASNCESHTETKEDASSSQGVAPLSPAVSQKRMDDHNVISARRSSTGEENKNVEGLHRQKIRRSSGTKNAKLFDVNKNEQSVEDLTTSSCCLGSQTTRIDGKDTVSELQTDTNKSRICKCGRTGTHSRLTCLGQRCPCYSMKLPCIGCKCRGCRNPKKAPLAASSDTQFVVNGNKIDTESCIDIV